MAKRRKKAKVHTRKIKRRSKAARKRPGKSFKYVKVRPKRRKRRK